MALFESAIHYNIIVFIWNFRTYLRKWMEATLCELNQIFEQLFPFFVNVENAQGQKFPQLQRQNNTWNCLTFLNKSVQHHYSCTCTCKFDCSTILKNNKFTILFQVWQLGSSTPNFTLEGHEKVNLQVYYD